MSRPKKSRSPLRVSPQPTSTVDQSERTRAAILNAALDFVWSHPFRDLTVSKLMAPTGVSRSCFYHHFNDLRHVIETLLEMLRSEIMAACEPWFRGVGDPVALLRDSLAGLVRVCHQRGPLLRAVSDAAAADSRVEKAWTQFLRSFDDAVCARLEADQKQSLIPDFDARPVAVALNRLDAHTLIHAFGKRPRHKPEPVREALVRIWISSTYGAEWLRKAHSDLIRS